MAVGACRAALLRRHSLPVLKTFALLFVLSFLWLQLRIASFKPEQFVEHTRDNDLDLAYLANLSSAMDALNATEPPTLHELQQLIDRWNAEQKVLNARRFGPLRRGDPVVVIQVHNRGQYLYALIESLRLADGIERALLVFSHDLFDQQINALIQRITFCKVLQIFYPYSIQLHPNEFPGQDPDDCPRDIPKEDAAKKMCKNAHHPDSYGHYREAKFTQTKHHWWWKVNHVFDGLTMTFNHTGPFLFLEEDHYVAPDCLHILRLMEDLQKRQCDHCDMLCLGTYVKTFNYAMLSRHVEAVKWLSSKHNMGMVMYRPLWNRIKHCAKAFCTFDDYNWDWSLQHVSSTCLSSHLSVLVTMAPRVFHIGECGVHHRGKDCSSAKVVKKVGRILTAAKRYLFPESLALRQGLHRQYKTPKGNGGWGDLRDHALCLQQVNSNVTLVSER